ncbi:MAG: hypothetical protein ACK41P_08095 [Asticcacaulis sp.]
MLNRQGRFSVNPVMTLSHRTLSVRPVARALRRDDTVRVRIGMMAGLIVTLMTIITTTTTTAFSAGAG